MHAILGLLVLIADIYALFNIIQSKDDNTRKVIWVVVVLIFPLLGAIIWFLAGPKK